MAKKKQKATPDEAPAEAPETPDEDDEELDLEELAEETEEEAPADDDDTDEEATTKKKKAKKKKTKKSRPTLRAEGTIGTTELAEALETDGKGLRILLRDKGAPKNDNNRYEWPSIAAALKVLGFKTVESAKTALKEARDKRLDVLKEKQKETRAAKGEKKTNQKQKKKAKKSA